MLVVVGMHANMITEQGVVVDVGSPSLGFGWGESVGVGVGGGDVVLPHP